MCTTNNDPGPIIIAPKNRVTGTNISRRRDMLYATPN